MLLIENSNLKNRKSINTYYLHDFNVIVLTFMFTFMIIFLLYQRDRIWWTSIAILKATQFLALRADHFFVYVNVMVW